jgi:hypothetical protein
MSRSELDQIASLDRVIGADELSRARRPEIHGRTVDSLGTVAVYTFAERVRHYRDLVGDLEREVAQDYELLTELRCRSIIGRLLGEVSPALRQRLEDELIGPLDSKFVAATFDDGGAYLRSSFGDQVEGDGWWWSRRPSYFTDSS